MCTDEYLGSGHVVEIYGEDGTLALKNETADYVTGFECRVGTRRAGQWSQIAGGERAVEVGDGRLAALSQLVRRFVDSVRDGGAITPNLADGVRVQTLLSRAAAAAQVGGRQCAHAAMTTVLAAAIVIPVSSEDSQHPRVLESLKAIDLPVAC